MRYFFCVAQPPSAVPNDFHSRGRLCYIGKSLLSRPSAAAMSTALLLALTAGCHKEQAEAKHSVSEYPVVRSVKPELRTIDCAVDQPGFVDAYEQTSIFSKVSGFIRHFYVDIGQEVKMGELLADIFVPELDEEHQRKAAQVELDKRLVEQAQQLVTVAESNVQMAIAQLAEAKANVGKYQAEVVRWESELKRLTQMVAEKVVDRQILTETQRQFDSAKAARRRAGHGGCQGSRRGNRPSQPGKNQDRRGNRQGPGQGS